MSSELSGAHGAHGAHGAPGRYSCYANGAAALGTLPTGYGYTPLGGRAVGTAVAAQQHNNNAHTGVGAVGVGVGGVGGGGLAAQLASLGGGDSWGLGLAAGKPSGAADTHQVGGREGRVG